MIRNIVFNILLLIICIFLPFKASCESSSVKTSLFDVGIENTRLIYGQYTFRNHFTGRLNVSVFSEKLGFQYIRATLGYQTSFKTINVSAKYFFGSAFNHSYYNTGVRVAADAVFVKRLLVDATIAPWYDSGYKYETCWEAKIGCRITKNIDIKAGYTTLPEYRMSEHRIIGGFDFHVKQLYVSPYLSIGTNSENGGKNIRVVFGFGYQF